MLQSTQDTNITRSFWGVVFVRKKSKRQYEVKLWIQLAKRCSTTDATWFKKKKVNSSFVLPAFEFYVNINRITILSAPLVEWLERPPRSR